MELKNQIIPSLSYDYSNSLHTQFNDRMYAIVGKVEAKLINIPATFLTDWRKYIDLEIAINAEIAASANTKLMSTKDSERDTQVSYLYEDIRNQLRSPFPEKKAAAEKLILIVNKFNGIQKQADDVETSDLKSLISDLKSPDNAPFCTTLGLDELINLLETTNNEFEALKATRTTERTEGSLPQSKATRKQTDELYSQICKIIEVAYLISSSEEDKKSILTLIGEMNQYITETKASYRQSQASKGSKEEESLDL